MGRNEAERCGAEPKGADEVTSQEAQQIAEYLCCYKQPHPIWGVLCFCIGLICLVLAANCWRLPNGTTEARKAAFGLIGFIPLILGLWLINLSFGLIYFDVFPCVCR